MARRAFVLGANGPDGPDRLKYASADAERIAKVLALPEYLFTVEPPSRPNDPYEIKRELDALATSCTEDDAFIFFFSGHGELIHGGLMLVLDGTEPDKITTYLPISWVTEARDRCPARNRLIILDCCHAGAAVGAKSKGSIDIINLGIESKTEVMMLASRKLEIAREFEHLRGSFLTSEICGFLNDQRSDTVRLRDVMDYLHGAAVRHNRLKPSDMPVVPIPFLNGNQQGDFLFTIRSKPRKRYWTPVSIRIDGQNLIWDGVHGEQQTVYHKANLAGCKTVRAGQPREPSFVVWTHPFSGVKYIPNVALVTAYSRSRRRLWEYEFDGESPFTNQFTYNFTLLSR